VAGLSHAEIHALLTHLAGERKRPSTDHALLLSAIRKLEKELLKP
jgi:hypothetical protein